MEFLGSGKMGALFLGNFGKLDSQKDAQQPSGLKPGIIQDRRPHLPFHSRSARNDVQQIAILIACAVCHGGSPWRRWPITAYAIPQRSGSRCYLRSRGCGCIGDDAERCSVQRARAWHRTGACRGWWRRLGLTSTVIPYPTVRMFGCRRDWASSPPQV